TVDGRNDITGNLGDGAIENNGTLIVTSCILSDASNSNSGTGGALSNYGTATFSNSTFTGNSARVGGAIFNSGVLTINGSTLEANSLNEFTDVNARGGAIFNQRALTINNSTLAQNIAQGGAAGFLSAGSSITNVAGHGMGGGIYMSAGTLSINSSTLSA